MNYADFKGAYEETPSVLELRQMTGLSQTKFGEKYGIPMRTIQNWENGVNAAPEYVRRLLHFAVLSGITE